MAPKNVYVGISNNDRISVLPDGVLCHVLSFLPTKYSVRTKVLSTRWKQLSTFVPNLDFECDSVLTRDSRANTISFLKFVHSFFVSYNLSYMNKFRFHLQNWEDLPEYFPEYFPLFSWISTATRLHVKEINICIYFPLYRVMPTDLFCCKTLTILSLRGRLYIVLPRSVSFPCLKTCVFEEVCFIVKSTGRLFRSCPVLETLLLSYCSFKQNGEVLDISVPTLKRLVFRECGKFPQLKFDVPNLVYFEYMGSLSTKLLGLGSLKSVVDAHLRFKNPDAYILELVRSVSHVQQLDLSGNLIQSFLDSGFELPIFNNMTRMRFGHIKRSSLRLLLHLLNNTPRLEFLSFNQGEWLDGYDEKNEKNNVLPELVPACVSLHLKEVDFKKFNGLDYEFELVIFFLKHANNLKVMKMQTRKIWDEQFEVSSAACQIVYYSSQRG